MKLFIPHFSVPFLSARWAHRVMLTFAVSLVAVVWARPTRAEPPPPDEATLSGGAQEDACSATAGKAVRELVEDGKTHAHAADWKCARRSFQTAFAQQESFDIAGNLGIVTHELAKSSGDAMLYAEAATHLTSALRGFPVSGSTEQRSMLEQRAADCRRRVVALSIALVPATACLRIGERRVGCGPFSHDLFAPPGALKILAQAPGYPSREVSIPPVLAGKRVSRKIDLSAATIVPPVAAEEMPDRIRPVPWWPGAAAGGVALVGAAVGIGLVVAGHNAGLEAVALAEQVEDEVGRSNYCASPVPAGLEDSCAQIASGLAQHDELKNIAVGLFVGSGVMALGAGAVIASHFLVEQPGKDSAMRWTVTPSVSPRGDVGIVVGGTF